MSSSHLVVRAHPLSVLSEVWLRNFGPKCDVWSVGVMGFQLLAGELPFLAKDHKSLRAKARAELRQLSLGC